MLKDTGHGNALALRADGTILAAGRSGGDMAVVQLGAGGTIDTSFGTAGIATARLISSGEDAAAAMAVQPDGKLILAGASIGKDGTLAALARYSADGSLDKSFGDGGRVRVALAPGAESIRSIAVLADGKILVAGYTDYNTGFIARFNSDGSVDATFGEGGSIRLEAVYALKTLAGGKFLLVCRSDTQELRRYNADGSLDESFAANGALALPGLSVQSDTLVVQDDGTILIAGSENDDPGNGISFFAVWRIAAGGMLDATFGDGGKAKIDVQGFWNDVPYALAVQEDGKIVAAGLKTYYFGSDFAVARFNADGTPDFSFGDRGVVITAFPPDHPIDFGGATNFAMTVSIQVDGKIVVSGVDDVDAPAGSPFPSATVFALARYNPDGSLDNSFGVQGKLTTAFGANAKPAAALITADGKLIVAGMGQPAATGQDFAIARYLLTDPNPITATLENGILKIRGTDVSETIRLRFADGILSIDGVSQTFARALFSRIEIDGKGGNDSIDASAAPTSVRIDAGAGNDSVLGGAYADVLLGNAGNDTIFGGGGADILRGGDGNDYLNGGPGADQIFGELGNDQIFTLDKVTDSIDGGDGFDRVKSDVSDLLANTEGMLA